jgi:antitoxin ParD1/3/4
LALPERDPGFALGARARKKFVEAEVASGRYKSASEVFREGLRLLQDREEKRKVALDEARRKVRKGLEALERGDPFDGEDVLREILGESRRRHAR